MAGGDIKLQSSCFLLLRRRCTLLNIQLIALICFFAIDPIRRWLGHVGKCRIFHNTRVHHGRFLSPGLYGKGDFSHASICQASLF